MDGWKEGGINGWTNGKAADGQMEGGRVDAWTDGRMDRMTEGRREGWTDG